MNNKKILYSAVILDSKSKHTLLEKLSNGIPKGWKIYAHHMTIIFGKGLDDKNEVGKKVELIATDLGVSDKAIAVKVSGYNSNNKIPHVTVAVNVNEGGKPVMSNHITKWTPLNETIILTGVVTEITN